jgi:hypothetical protein
LSCHPRDAGPELNSSTCPGDEAGTGDHLVLGGARYSSSTASVVPALPAPMVIVPADGEVLKSEPLGKYFNDKDGVRRECGDSKPSSKELARVMGLCRLLNFYPQTFGFQGLSSSGEGIAGTIPDWAVECGRLVRRGLSSFFHGVGHSFESRQQMHSDWKGSARYCFARCCKDDGRSL